MKFLTLNCNDLAVPLPNFKPRYYFPDNESIISDINGAK